MQQHSFYQRQHLSGRYVDKIQKPAKINTENPAEFKLQEFPLSADNGTTELSIIFNEDTIPKVLADTAANQEEDYIYFKPDTLRKEDKSIVKQNEVDPAAQKEYNDLIKKSVLYYFFAWLSRIVAFVVLFLYIFHGAAHLRFANFSYGRYMDIGTFDFDVIFIFYL